MSSCMEFKHDEDTRLIIENGVDEIELHPIINEEEMDEKIMKNYLLRSFKRKPVTIVTACAILLWFVMVTYAAIQTFEIEIRRASLLQDIPSPKKFSQGKKNGLTEEDKKFDEQQKDFLNHEFYQYKKNHAKDDDNNFAKAAKSSIDVMNYGKGGGMNMTFNAISIDVDKDAMQKEKSKHKKVLKSWVDQEIAMKERIKNLTQHLLHREEDKEKEEQEQEEKEEDTELQRIVKPNLFEEGRRKKIQDSITKNSSSNRVKNKNRDKERHTVSRPKTTQSLSSVTFELNINEKLTYTSESDTPEPSYDKTITKNIQSEIGPISHYNDIVYNTDQKVKRKKLTYSLPYYEKYFMLGIKDDELSTLSTIDETVKEIGPISEYVDLQRKENDEESDDWMHVFGKATSHDDWNILGKDDGAKLATFYWGDSVDEN